MLAGGLSNPGDGILGAIAGAANPLVAQTIKGMVNDGTLDKGGLGHILAHGIAGAAMAAASGGDLLAGAISAGGAEALAPIIAEFLYGKGDNPNDLTADEKNTLSAIIGILGTGTGALTGDSSIDAIIGDSVATNAVENNHLIPKELQGCAHSNSALCGAEQKLIDKLLENGVPSYEDITAKIEACAQGPSCTQAKENAIRLEGIEATKEKISDLFANGELSRQELALLNNQLAADISEYMRQEGNVGEEISWKEKPYGYFIDENNIKEKMASGLSREEAEFDALIDKTLEMGIALGGIGGIKGGGKKPGNSNDKDKTKEESGKKDQTSDNKLNLGKDNTQNSGFDELASMYNDKNINVIDFEIKIDGKTHRPDLNKTNPNGGAPIYSGLSDKEIYKYFESLAGDAKINKTITPKGTVYNTKLSDGTILNLRDFSKSDSSKWTIDIQKHSKFKNRTEIKFD